MARYIITEKARHIVADHGNTGVGTVLELQPERAARFVVAGELLPVDEQESPPAAPATAP